MAGQSVHLPTNLQSCLGASVNLDMDTDKPYELNAEHLQQYPRIRMLPARVERRSNGHTCKKEEEAGG